MIDMVCDARQRYVFFICDVFQVPGCANPPSTTGHVTCTWRIGERRFGVLALFRGFECVRKCMTYVCDCDL